MALRQSERRLGDLKLAAAAAAGRSEGTAAWQRLWVAGLSGPAGPGRQPRRVAIQLLFGWRFEPDGGRAAHGLPEMWLFAAGSPALYRTPLQAAVHRYLRSALSNWMVGVLSVPACCSALRHRLMLLG